jgi:hypothetical protein
VLRIALRSWSERLTDLFGTAVDGDVYFNNDAGGCAVRNAATFTRVSRGARAA